MPESMSDFDFIDEGQLHPKHKISFLWSIFPSLKNDPHTFLY